MLTTPKVARFHNPDAPSSATATLKCARSRSFRLRTTCRLSLRDCAASMRSSRVRKAIMRSSVVGLWSLANHFWHGRTTNDERRPLHHSFRCDLLGHEGLDHVADFNVAIVGDGDAAFHAVGYLAGVVFEAAQRVDFAFEDHHV